MNSKMPNKVNKFQGPITSSIGINTLSSGTLKINVQCVMQTQEFMSDEFFYKMKYGTMRRDG